MTQKNRYRISFPNPDKRPTAARYLFSLNLYSKDVMSLCSQPIERFVAEKSDGWVLACLGALTFEKIICLNQVSELIDIDDEAYARLLDLLFEGVSLAQLASGRPYRGKAQMTAHHADGMDISHQIIAYWEQGVKLTSAILYNYLDQILYGQNHIAISLQNLLSKLIKFRKNVGLRHELSNSQIQAMLEYDPIYVVSYYDNAWHATRADMSAFGGKKRGMKPKAQKRFDDLLSDELIPPAIEPTPKHLKTEREDVRPTPLTPPQDQRPTPPTAPAANERGTQAASSPQKNESAASELEKLDIRALVHQRMGF